jgi:hypothetical protein
MKDGKPDGGGDPESRRPGSAGKKGDGPGRKSGFVERATARGHSGYGAESVRPHLRDQLRLKALLPQPFPTPEQDKQPGKDKRRR